MAYCGFFLGGMVGILEQYPNLFEKGGDDDQELRDDYYSTWGWYVVLDFLSNSDRTKWNYFLNDMSIIEFLNTYAFYKDKQKCLALEASQRS